MFTSTQQNTEQDVWLLFPTSGRFLALNNKSPWFDGQKIRYHQSLKINGIILHPIQVLELDWTKILSLTSCCNTLWSSTWFWWWCGVIFVCLQIFVYLLARQHFLDGYKVWRTYLDHILNSGTTIAVWYTFGKTFQSGNSELGFERKILRWR